MAIVSLSDYATTLNVSAGDSVLAAIQPAIDAAVSRFLRYDPEQSTRTEFYPRRGHPFAGVGERGQWESDGTRAFWISRYGNTRMSDVIQLRHLAVRGAPTVYEERGALAGQKSGSFASDTQLTSGDQFWLDASENDGDGTLLSRSGQLIRRGSSWPDELGSIKVTYTAGYSSDEFAGTASSNVDASDIAVACKLLMQKMYMTIKSTGSSSTGVVAGVKLSERMGDYGYSTEGNTARQLAGMSSNIIGEIAELLQPYVNYGWDAG